MIKLILGDIVDNIEVFSELSKKEMPAIQAFHLAHILDRITKEYNLFQETRDKLIYKYGDHDENGKLIIDAEGHVNLNLDSTIAFNQELSELIREEIIINEEPIPLSALEKNNFTPGQMYLLQPLISY